MLKVVHIHTNKIFLKDTERFNKNSFSNTVVLISNNISDYEINYPQIINVTTSKTDIRKVVEICSSADLIVLYELDPIKSYIALKIPQYITIAWRFFGTELYDKNIVSYLSDKSQKFYNTKKEKLSKIFNHKILFAKGASLISNRSFPENNFKDAIKRVDLFLCLSKYEYDHLAQFWKNLPSFVQIPLKIISRRNINDKKDTIVIGNSRNIYNNHIDVIELIENAHFSTPLTFIIPFSYGMENFYTNEIERLVRNSQKDFKLLENFLSFESYFNYITGAKAAVFNCYRQMAMGNIVQLINSGAKVYLNTRNVIYHWLKDFELKVFTIEDFASDLESNKLELSHEEKEKNFNLHDRISLLFNMDQSNNEIHNFVLNKKKRMKHPIKMPNGF